MRMVMVALVAVGLLCLEAGAQPERLSSRLEESAKLRSYYRVTKDFFGDGLKKVRVAILAEGFAGLSEEDKESPYLPPGTKNFFQHEGEGHSSPDPLDDSGRRAGQVAWAMWGYSDDVYPILRNYNAKGLLSFRTSVLAAREWKADVIVCLVNFESFGNFDGTGGVNRLVEDTVRGGTIWIQSAGEYHKKTYNAEVKLENFAGGKWVKFGKDFFLPFKINADRTDVEITLSWNSFSPGREFRGTDKDLDLYFFAPTDKRTSEATASDKSVLKQVKGETGEGETNISIERIERTQARGKNSPGKGLLRSSKDPYYLGVKYVGGEFDPASDKLRITVWSRYKKPFIDSTDKNAKPIDPVELIGAGTTASIPIPADTRFGITMGDDGDRSSVGPTVDGRPKPDGKLDNTSTFFSDKRGFGGPHVAAVKMGAMAALLRGIAPEFETVHLRKLLETQKGIAPRKATDDLAADVKNLTKDGYTLGTELIVKSLTDKKWKNIGDAIETVPVAAARYKDPAVLVFAITKHPLSIDLFSDVSEEVKDSPEDYAFYVYPSWNGSKYEFKGFVKKVGSKGYPWESPSGGTVNDYVLLRGWQELRIANPTRSPFFKLPTVDELKKLVKKE